MSAAWSAERFGLLQLGSGVSESRLWRFLHPTPRKEAFVRPAHISRQDCSSPECTRIIFTKLRGKKGRNIPKATTNVAGGLQINIWLK